MDQELCFCLNGVDLWREHLLVTYNHVPIYFLCKDQDGAFYIALNCDIDQDDYIVAKVSPQDVLDLLEGTLSMAGIILKQSHFWAISAGDNPEDDHCEERSMHLIPHEDLPDADGYLWKDDPDNLAYRKKLELELLNRQENWLEMASPGTIHEEILLSYDIHSEGFTELPPSRSSFMTLQVGDLQKNVGESKDYKSSSVQKEASWNCCTTQFDINAKIGAA